MRSFKRRMLRIITVPYLMRNRSNFLMKKKKKMLWAISNISSRLNGKAEMKAKV